MAQTAKLMMRWLQVPAAADAAIIKTQTDLETEDPTMALRIGKTWLYHN